MIHHSAVSIAKNRDQFVANNNYHRSKWNFKSSLGFYLGYNYEISAGGKITQARAEGETTAACYQKDMNDGRAIHICIDGNFDIEKPTDNQIYALRDLMRRLVKKYSINPENIVYHNDYSETRCPGSYLIEQKDFIVGLGYEKKVIEKPEENLKGRILIMISGLLDLLKKWINQK